MAAAGRVTVPSEPDQVASATRSGRSPVRPDVAMTAPVACQQFDTIRRTGNRSDGQTGPYIRYAGGEDTHIGLAAAGDGAPDRPTGQLEKSMSLAEANE